jgi:hypothetical protein
MIDEAKLKAFMGKMLGGQDSALPTYSAIILMAARDLKSKLAPAYAPLYQSGMAGSPASKA